MSATTTTQITDVDPRRRRPAPRRHDHPHHDRQGRLRVHASRLPRRRRPLRQGRRRTALGLPQGRLARAARRDRLRQRPARPRHRELAAPALRRARLRPPHPAARRHHRRRRHQGLPGQPRLAAPAHPPRPLGPGPRQAARRRRAAPAVDGAGMPEPDRRSSVGDHLERFRAPPAARHHLAHRGGVPRGRPHGDVRRGAVRGLRPALPPPARLPLRGRRRRARLILPDGTLARRGHRGRHPLP